jgi:hypothetical protein
MASGCKPDGLISYVGSNPTPCTRFDFGFAKLIRNQDAGVAQLVERQPSKLNVASSSLVSRSKSFEIISICSRSSVVERILGKDEVMSSILIESL